MHKDRPPLEERLTTAKGAAMEVSALLAKPRESYWRGDIDGLRCVAVLATIIYHIDPTLCPGGFQGVDIFFVISGYVRHISSNIQP